MLCVWWMPASLPCVCGECQGRCWYRQKQSVLRIPFRPWWICPLHKMGGWACNSAVLTQHSLSTEICFSASCEGILSFIPIPLEICQQVLAVRVIGKARATKRTIFVLLKWWGMLVVLECPRSHCLLSMSFLKVCLWVPVLLYEDDLSKKWSVDVLSAVATPQDGLGSSLSVLQKLTNQKLCSAYGECRGSLDGRKGSLFSEFLKDLGMKSVCQHWLTQKLSVWHGILCFIPRFLFEICQQVLALLDMDQAEKSCISCVFVAQSERRFPVQMAQNACSAVVSQKNSFNFLKARKMHLVSHPLGWN